MSVPQPGIFAQGTRSHRHLEFDRNDGVTTEQLRTTLGELEQPDMASGGVNVVIGFGARTWAALAGGRAPSTLPSFAMDGLPSTPHDIWVWVHGADEGVVFDAARLVVGGLVPVATLAAEADCFIYRDSRDITGFIDGTENPHGAEAAEAALVPMGIPGAAGSYGFTQRWIHDLASFDTLSVEEQEKVIGRTKLDSVELDDDVRPDDAHISRVVIDDDDGDELEIYRRSVPYGTAAEHGLYFVAFTHDPDRVERMLSRMFGGDGPTDRLTQFSTPVSGAWYFVPSLGDLEAVTG